MNAYPHTEQRTLAWYRERLGKITGSQVGAIIGKGRGAEFTKTGLTYLNSVGAERMIPPMITEDEELFSQYIDEVSVTSKVLRIGTEREAEARELYSEVRKCEVIEAGSIPSASLEGFASSPDGLILDSGGAIEGTIEIKCPKPSTYFEYLASIRDARTLQEVNPDYYWQCISHMEVTDARWCDFIVYCPYSRLPLHIVRVGRDGEAVARLRERVSAANRHLAKILASI